MKKTVPSLFLALTVCGSFALAAVEGDNTKVNQADRELTADQQGMSAMDLKISQTIRKRLMKERNLSTYAYNVKIITQDGHVTLKGPVRTEVEKKRVMQMAQAVAGVADVMSEMTVVPETKQ